VDPVPDPLLLRKFGREYKTDTVTVNYRLENIGLWVVTPRSLVEVHRRFGETYCLQLQDRSSSQVINQKKKTWS
jgi:hypothetical protein